jgi:hypothetical protein
MGELNCLWRILRKARHRVVADALLKGFMWACWPEWYERNKWEFYQVCLSLRLQEKEGKAGALAGEKKA